MRRQFVFTRLVFISLLFVILSLSARAQSSAPRQEKLLNGLKILMWSQPDAAKVSVKLRVHAGASFDQQGKEGSTCMLAEAFFPTKEGREFFVDDLGGNLQITCNYDYVEIDATSKPEAYLTMLETIATAVSNPTLDKQTADAVENALVSKLANDEKSAAVSADLAVRKRLFGTFPYGRPVYGSSDSLKNVDFADLRFIYDRLFGADNATIAVTGNFQSDVAFRAIRRFYGPWSKLDRKVPSTFKQPDPPAAATQMIESTENGITEIRYAVRGVARNDREYAAANVVSKILEERVRAKSPTGQRENVWVKNYANVLPGVLVIGFSRIQREITATVTSERPKFEANEIISNAIAEKITDSEFNTAKSAALADQSRIDPATRWLDMDTYRFVSVKADQNAFESVTSSDVQSFAERLKLQPVASVVLLSQKSGN
jgi:predicted Zn-dependent peptidase